MLNPSGVKIWRPRQIYLGEGEREYVDAASRKEKEKIGVFDAPVQVSHGGDSKRNRLATYKDEMGHTLRPKL
jgi:citrate synthase